jgi:hypothetical protein
MSAQLRVLVTGSREFANRDAMNEVFECLRDHYVGCETTLVHGDARGADKLSALVASSMVPDLTVETHPAEWGRLGKSAGLVRNQQMVDLGADVAIAFLWLDAQNRGTKDCMSRVRSAGIPLIQVVADSDTWAITWFDGSVVHSENVMPFDHYPFS